LISEPWLIHAEIGRENLNPVTWFRRGSEINEEDEDQVCDYSISSEINY